MTKERNHILALKYIKTYESSGKKSSDIYRYKLGFVNQYLLESQDKDDVQSKADIDINDDKSNPEKDTFDGQPEDNEFLPKVRDRSQTIVSKQEAFVPMRQKKSQFISKQHQAYSILKYKESRNSPKTSRNLVQSRVESYHRLPMTTFDNIDDEIIDKGLFDIHSRSK